MAIFDWFLGRLRTQDIPSWSGTGNVSAWWALPADEIVVGAWTTNVATSWKKFVTTVGSPWSDNSVPTEKAVRSAIGAASGDVTWPASATADGITLFNSTTGKLIKDSGKTIVTSLWTDDTTVPTSKAVKDVTDLKLKLDQSTPQTITGRQNQQDGIQFWLTPTVWATSQGKVFWDATNRTLAVDMWNWVIQQIGMEFYAPLVKNTTASTITNWQVVYVNWHDWTYPTVWLAKADSISTCFALWFATENITAWWTWLITRMWLINDLDTHTFTAWQQIFLSASTAWLYTTTAVSTPNISIQLWIIGKIWNTDGNILIDIGNIHSTDVLLSSNSDSVDSSQKAVKTYVDQRWIDVNRYGFIPWETTLTFNWTNAVTITPVSTTWNYYRAGIKYNITWAKSVVIPWSPITTGKYYIYIDAVDWTLTQSNTQWTLNDTKVPVATLYFNDTLTPKFEFADERHTCLIDRREHMYEHYTAGTKFSSGWNLSWYTLNTATDAGNTYGIAAANIFDEDLYKTLTELVDTNWTTANYKTAYRTAASTWVWALTNMPFLYTGAWAPYWYIQYDNAWTMTDSANNRWVNYYVYMTNVVAWTEATQWTSTQAGRFMIIPWRWSFNSAALAYAENPATFSFAWFPVDEAVCVRQITYNTSWVANTVKGRCVMDRVQKVASNIISSSTSVSANHDWLAWVNLAGAWVTYWHIDDQTQTIAWAKTFSSDVTVPAEAYWAWWNGSNEVPTKNDTYDQVELKAPLANPSFTWVVTTAGNIELWHATDTTISRVSAWVIAVEWVTIPSISSTNTLTNKRIDPRKVETTSYTTDTGTSLDVSTTDIFVITAQAWALKFNNPWWTPVWWQKLIIRIKDNGTARALTYDTQFRAMWVALPSTTVINKILYMWFIYNGTDTKRDLVAVAQEA